MGTITAAFRDEAGKQRVVFPASGTEVVPTLAEVPQLCDRMLVQLAALEGPNSPPNAALLTKALEQSAHSSADMLSRLSRLARTCDQIVDEMDFSFLFDVDRKLFAIGYNVTASRADDSYYDLLASEARLASFVGIAKGDAATALVPHGPRAHESRRRPRTDFMDRHDVRIPDAAAGHARLSEHTARRKLIAPSSTARSNMAKNAVCPGAFRSRVQRARSSSQLSVWTIRSSRPRIETRPDRKPVVAPYA